jgi:hypothetical protein
MPAGTETSMAMPVFGFDGQVSVIWSVFSRKR